MVNVFLFCFDLSFFLISSCSKKNTFLWSELGQGADDVLHCLQTMQVIVEFSNTFPLHCSLLLKIECYYFRLLQKADIPLNCFQGQSIGKRVFCILTPSS